VNADDKPSQNRRRNPFPAFTDTEYELFMATIREEARNGARSAIAEHLDDYCKQHRERTENIEAVVFGRAERGIVGLDQRMARAEETVTAWADDRQWFKRMVYTAVVTAVVGVIIAVVPILLNG